MPALCITSNVKPDDLKSFVLEFSKLAASTLGKPEKLISVSFDHQEHLSFAGSFEPAFLMTVTSLDNISPEKNVAYSKAFFAFFKEKLGASDERGYITYNDPGRAFLGYKSTTADLWK